MDSGQNQTQHIFCEEIRSWQLAAHVCRSGCISLPLNSALTQDAEDRLRHYLYALSAIFGAE